MRKFTCLCLAITLGMFFGLTDLASTTAHAAFGVPGVPGVGSVGRQVINAGERKATSSQSSSRASGDLTPSKLSFKQPVTIVHHERNFQYTIPAGWGIVTRNDNLASNDIKNIPDHNPEFISIAVEGKQIGPCAFGITIQPMVPSFPRGSAVAASLKRDKERILIKEVVEAKRRDYGDKKKKCSVLGWQTTEDKRPQPSYRRGIYYQAYDQDNVMYVFGTGSEDMNFQQCQKDLSAIIESIKFCVK